MEWLIKLFLVGETTFGLIKLFWVGQTTFGLIKLLLCCFKLIDQSYWPILKCMLIFWVYGSYNISILYYFLWSTAIPFQAYIIVDALLWPTWWFSIFPNACIAAAATFRQSTINFLIKSNTLQYASRIRDQWVKQCKCLWMEQVLFCFSAFLLLFLGFLRKVHSIRAIGRSKQQEHQKAYRHHRCL